jgi:hypothetical protein
MKTRALITGIVLLPATGAAHAADRNQFAPEVLGLWCAQEGHNILAPRSTSYYREDWGDQDNKFILKSNEIEEWESGCLITKIKRETVPMLPVTTYMVMKLRKIVLGKDIPGNRRSGTRIFMEHVMS